MHPAHTLLAASAYFDALVLVKLIRLCLTAKVELCKLSRTWRDVTAAARARRKRPPEIPLRPSPTVPGLCASEIAASSLHLLPGSTAPRCCGRALCARDDPVSLYYFEVIAAFKRRPGPPRPTAAGCGLVHPNGAARVCYLPICSRYDSYTLVQSQRRFLPQPPYEGTPELRLPPMCPPPRGQPFPAVARPAAQPRPAHHLPIALSPIRCGNLPARAPCEKAERRE